VAYYHFVVRTSDHTHDDPHGTHFPNHEAAIGSCENSERAAMIRGMPPCSYTMRRDRQSTRSRFEQSRLASPIFLGLANDKRIYELCNPQRFGNRARNVNIVTRQVGAP